MTLHIETGHPVTADNKVIKENRIRFVTEDGRTMFEVSAGADGKSLEIRGVETTKVSGFIYSELLDVRPNVANSVTIMVRKYEEQQ